MSTADLFNLATAAHRKGNTQKARQFYRKLLKRVPDHGDALHLLGVIEAELGRYDLARDYISRALAINPGDGHALNDFGMILSAGEDFEGALAYFDKAAEFIPGDPDLLNNRGSALCQLERFEEALHCFDQGLSGHPENGDLLVNRGNALFGLARFEEALDCFDRVLELGHGDAALFNSRGNVLYGLRRYQEALEAYDRALALRPRYADALNNRGNLLEAMERYDDAIDSYNKALEIAPGFVSAILNRALTLQEVNRMESAVADFERVKEIDPDHKYVKGWLLHTMGHCCDWREFDAAVSDILADVRASKPCIPPFPFFAISDSAADQLECARTWVRETCPPAAEQLWGGEIYDHDRIRVAYVSADFHNHPMAYLMAGLFEHHDRSRFETIALSFGPHRPSPIRDRLERAFDRFIDVRLDSDLEIAHLIRELEVDIAIDRKGFTQNSRPDIFAFRPAPVQVNYLAYPGTMGADYIDYIIADRFVIPEADQIHYPEKVVYMPHSYQANDGSRPIAERTPTRAEAGLPEDGFVFCCFNNNFKLSPKMLGVWMGLLTAVEGSVLWLLEANTASARNLRAEAEKRGISGDRLVFAKRVPNPDHLARHRLADLSLDTLPFNAHTTASDALWAGLPMLTCTGTTFAGRVTTGLLHAVGLPELITENLEDYAALALSLARNPTALQDIREKLARNLKTEPLYDTDRYRKDLETAFETMWRRAQSGLAPESFSVA